MSEIEHTMRGQSDVMRQLPPDTVIRIWLDESRYITIRLVEHSRVEIESFAQGPSRSHRAPMQLQPSLNGVIIR
jgi:hypothetical protein